MSDLEGAFKALMAETITGEAALPGRQITLGRSSQQVVATWVVKTWLLFELATENARGGATKSPDTLAYLYERGRPPLHFKVWIGAYRPPPKLAVNFRSALVLSDEKRIGAIVLLTIGTLLLVIFVPEVAENGDGLDANLNLAGKLPLALLQVWPRQVHEVRWPPSAILSEEALRVLVPEEGPLRT